MKDASDKQTNQPGAAPGAAVALSADERRERYRQAAALLRQWREASDGYDEEVWTLLEQELKGDRTEPSE